MFFAHFAVTDETGETFYHTETIGRPALKMAGGLEDRYKVWIGKWSAELLDDDKTHRLTAQGPESAISLDLVSAKSPVIHGHDGVSRKADGEGRASHYYSLTRLETSGTLTLNGEEHTVTGLSWMDHEFGTNQLTSRQQGWDWFSIQLDNNRELMLYVLRLKDGSLEPESSGTVVAADGTWKHLDLSMYTIQNTDTWTSPHNGATYPSGWTIKVPDEEIELQLTPTVEDQELVSRSILGITYWEGSVLVKGIDQGNPVSGMGYVELTGYIGKVPGF
jgi:predicted secreted hydrolase